MVAQASGLSREGLIHSQHEESGGTIDMPKKFAGKIAVVTGGSTGMGLATAKRFGQEGMDHVFIAGRRKDALDAAVADIGKNMTAVEGDVAGHSDLIRF